MVPLDSEYDAGMIFKLGTLQAAHLSWPDVHNTACLQLGRPVSSLRGWQASFGDTQPMWFACQVESLSTRCLEAKHSLHRKSGQAGSRYVGIEGKNGLVLP